jgi:hypothetical protein
VNRPRFVTFVAIFANKGDKALQVGVSDRCRVGVAAAVQGAAGWFAGRTSGLEVRQWQYLGA